VCTVDQAILDDDGNECAPGEIGEICWRGAQAMNGYYNNPEATAEASRFGWHHSGDLGLIDAEGQLLFLDRKKDTIKSGGENVSSMKVEQALLAFEGAIQAAAFAVPHPHWGEAVCACLVVQDNADATEDAVISHCKELLGKFEVPKRVMLVGELPMTGTGKVRKVELRQQYSQLFASSEA
jgi:long-chain acyl-CoA synthetase